MNDPDYTSLLYTHCLYQHGTYSSEMIDKLLMFVMSEEGLRLKSKILCRIVANLNLSIIYPYSKDKYFQHFKSLSDKVKVRLASETIISHVLTSTNQDRSEYLNILLSISTINNPQWHQILKILEMHFGLLAGGDNIDKCDDLIRQFCVQPPLELVKEYSVFPSLLKRLQFDTMKYYLDNNMIGQARSLVDFTE